MRATGGGFRVFGLLGLVLFRAVGLGTGGTA